MTGFALLRVLHQVEADGSSRLIEQLRMNEIVAVTEIPEDADAGWLGGFRVRDPTQSGWFPAHVVSRVPEAQALRGKLAQMLPEPDSGAGLHAREAAMLVEEQEVLAQLEMQDDEDAAALGEGPPEGDSDGEDAQWAALKKIYRTQSGGGADGRGDGKVPGARVADKRLAAANKSWSVAASPAEVKARIMDSSSSDDEGPLTPSRTPASRGRARP